MDFEYYTIEKDLKEVIVSYVVYLDVFLIINIFMDFLILVIAKSLIKPQTTLLRCFTGAGVGGLLSVISLLIPYRAIWLRFITSYILICFVMCLVTFRIKGIRSNIKNMCIVYAVTFCLGGAMNAIYYYTALGFVINRILSGEYVKTVNAMRFISIAIITYLLTDYLVKMINRRAEKGKQIYGVIIGVKDKTVKLNALLDTGNLLFEPISGREVHIIEYEAVKDIVDKENGFYRVIPFNSVGNSKGLLDAIEVDYIEVELKDACERHIRIDKPIIALYDKKLASDGKFEGLLHSSINHQI